MSIIQEQLDKGVSDWDGEIVLETPLSEDLVQLHTDKTIPYEGWVCEEEGCTQNENLWMNLSDGAILCGRFGKSLPIENIRLNIFFSPALSVRQPGQWERALGAACT